MAYKVDNRLHIPETIQISISISCIVMTSELAGEEKIDNKILVSTCTKSSALSIYF